MAERSEQGPILASDAEREHSIVLLRDAVTSGRLTLEEFSERVGQAQVARTDRDLAALTVDLPSVAPAPPAWPPPPGAPRLRIRVRGPGGTLHVRSSERRSRELTR